MASNKTGGFSKSQMKQLSNSLDTEVSKFQKALKALIADVDQLQKGDADGPYWNGALAYNWVSTCLKHIEHDKVLLDHLDRCSDYLSAIVKGGDSL